MATAGFLTDGAVSPAARRAAVIAVDGAAVPLGLAVLRALPPRADDPLRGIARQAAWRLGTTGLSGALLGGARIGTEALDDRLRPGQEKVDRRPARRDLTAADDVPGSPGRGCGTATGVAEG